MKSLLKFNRMSAYMIAFLAITDACIAILSHYKSVTIIVALIRVGLLLTILVVAKVRSSSNFYIPGFSEMNDVNYWQFASLVSIASTGAFIYSANVAGTSLSGVYIGLYLAYLLFVFVLYQTKPWASQQHLSRTNRLKKLKKKAKLNRNEWEIVKPFLITEDNKLEDAPFIWKVTKWVIVFTLAAFLNGFANMVVGLF